MIGSSIKSKILKTSCQAGEALALSLFAPSVQAHECRLLGQSKNVEIDQYGCVSVSQSKTATAPAQEP